MRRGKAKVLPPIKSPKLVTQHLTLGFKRPPMVIMLGASRKQSPKKVAAPLSLRQTQFSKDVYHINVPELHLSGGGHLLR
jgi:hypothetical protein